MFGFGKIFNRTTGIERAFGPVTVCDNPLYCQICRNAEFWQHRVQMHTPFATFFNVEFVNRVADCAVCSNCGYVHWFLPTQMAPTPSQSTDDPS